MVKGNRKAKAAARNTMDTHGSYVRTRRIMSNMKPCLNPSICGVQNHRPGTTCQSDATFSSSSRGPSLKSSIGAPDRKQEEPQEEVTGVQHFNDYYEMADALSEQSISDDLMKQTLVANRHIIPSGEDFEDTISSAWPHTPGVDGSQEFVQMCAGNVRQADGGYDFIDAESNVIARATNGVLVTEGQAEPDFLAGRVDRERLSAIRATEPNFGMNSDPRTMDEVLNDPAHQDLFRRLGQPHDDASGISYEAEILTIAERHGVHDGELRDRGFEIGISMPRPGSKAR